MSEWVGDEAGWQGGISPGTLVGVVSRGWVTVVLVVLVVVRLGLRVGVGVMMVLVLVLVLVLIVPRQWPISSLRAQQVGMRRSRGR